MSCASPKRASKRPRAGKTGASAPSSGASEADSRRNCNCTEECIPCRCLMQAERTSVCFLTEFHRTPEQIIEDDRLLAERKAKGGAR